jgi:GNAT superfamily N-acetyltransferase
VNAQPTIRPAKAGDLAAIEALIGRSIRTLGAGDYPSETIELALKGAFGTDTQLIRDGTYFVVEDHTGMLACGGWSYRKTLFGSDARDGRDPASLDPAVDAAKIRAFFVDPSAARRGIGTLLLAHCEAEAQKRGFRRFELMATLPGVRLYEVRGYRAGPHVHYPVGGGTTIHFVPMTKELPSTGSA